MTRWERGLGVVVAVGPAAVGRALLRVAVAAASSIVLPFGLARQAEPDPGFAFDGVVMIVGGLASLALVLLAVIIMTALFTLRAHQSTPARRSTLHSATTRRLPLAASLGLDFALRRGPRGERGPGRAPRSSACGGFHGSNRSAHARRQRQPSLHRPVVVRLDVGLGSGRSRRRLARQ